MEEEKIHIKIEVLQRQIDLWIKKEFESYYREAEKRINEKATDFAKRWNYIDHQDLLSKLLLDQTVNYIAKEEKLNSLLPRMERLSRLAELMEQALDALEQEEKEMMEPTSAQNVD